MDSQYRYAPLPKAGLVTRIIRLKPATDFCTTPQCEIVTANLDNRNSPILEYEAISYTWEGQRPSPAHYILCRCKDGGLSRLDTTMNSDAVLRRVRLLHEDRYIWMDAICINQSDKEEKQRQIEYMGYVYSLAKRVLVCLGERVTGNGLLTIEYIKKIATHDLSTTARPDLQRLFDDIRKSKAAILLVDEANTVEGSKPQKSIESGRNWSLMQELFGHPWFTRVWTLQEIALNPDSALIYYGDREMQWKEIICAMNVMRTFPFEHWAVLDDALGAFINVRSEIQHWRSSWSMDSSQQFFHFNPSNGERPELSKIVKYGRSRICSDPRDKIFGLYGICLFLDLYMPPPDYGKDLRQLYSEITKIIIESETSLTMLYEVGGRCRNDILPSWVPDYEHGYTNLSTPPVTLADMFNAGAPEPLFNIDSTRQTLKLRGAVVDVICWVGGLMPFSDKSPFLACIEPEFHLYPEMAEDRWQAFQVFREWVQCIHENVVRPDATNEFYYTVLQDSPNFLLEKKSRRSRLDPVKLCKENSAFNRWYDAILEGNRRVSKETRQDLKDMMNRVWCDRTLHPGGEGSDAELRFFHYQAWNISRGKKFFLTDKRMGTAQGGVAIGDVIAVVAGMKMPLILSPVGDNFRLVGHGYIHGIMDGEAWPSDRNGLRIIPLV